MRSLSVCCLDSIFDDVLQSWLQTATVLINAYADAGNVVDSASQAFLFL